MLSDIVRNHKLKTLKHPNRKNAWVTTLTAHIKTTGSTTNCGLAEQAITLMGGLCDIRHNVLDRTLEVQWRDQADKGFVPVSELVRNTMVTAPFNGAESDGVGILWCSMRFAANAENRRTKGQKNKRYNVCFDRLARKT